MFSPDSSVAGFRRGHRYTGYVRWAVARVRSKLHFIHFEINLIFSVKELCIHYVLYKEYDILHAVCDILRKEFVLSKSLTLLPPPFPSNGNSICLPNWACFGHAGKFMMPLGGLIDATPSSGLLGNLISRERGQ